MSWLIAIIVGGIIGWLASIVMNQRQQTVWLDIITGIIGAFLSRWFFGSVLGIGSALSAGSFSLLGILWGIIGAVILITIFRLVAPEYYRGGRESGREYYEEIKRDVDREKEKYRDKDKR